MDVEGLIEDCRREVEVGGFSVAALVGDELGCDWAYTIGLHGSFGHPELLIVGLEARVAGVLLELFGERVADGERLRTDRGLGIDGGLEFCVHEVDPLFGALGDWFDLGREVMACWGERWPASLQLVWSDRDAGHAGHPRHSTRCMRQPLLFGT